MHGNTVVTAVTLAIGENGSKIACFWHSARCAPKHWAGEEVLGYANNRLGLSNCLHTQPVVQA